MIFTAKQNFEQIAIQICLAYILSRNWIVTYDITGFLLQQEKYGMWNFEESWYKTSEFDPYWFLQACKQQTGRKPL